MSRFIFFLSCLFYKQSNCNVLGTVLNVDKTYPLNYSTKANNYYFFIEDSAISYAKWVESTGVASELSGKTKSYNKSDSTNIREISDMNIQVFTKLNSLKPEKADKSPYSVIIFVKTNKGLVSCTGTLLTLQWVLTAATCFMQATVVEVTIYAGGNAHEEWLNNKLAKGSQVRKGSEFHPHPYFHVVDVFKPFYNVAVIKADQVFRLSETVAPLELSNSHLSFARPTDCKVTSFGRVDLPTTSPNYFRKTRRLSVETPCICFAGDDTSYWICPKPHQSLGFCKGDIGAGLICDGKIKAFLSQIVPAQDARSCDLSKPEYYDCLTVNNTITVFQGTCAYLRFINQYVKLFSNKQVQRNCDVEPQESKPKNEKPGVAQACRGPYVTILYVLSVLILLFLGN